MNGTKCNWLGKLKWYQWSSFPTVQSYIPKEPGVYFLRWGPTMRANWCSIRLAPFFGSLVKTNPYVAKLNAKLVALCGGCTCSLVYIGKAGTDLRARLRAYHCSSVQYLAQPALVLATSTRPCGHAGGKAAWTLRGIVESAEFTWVPVKQFQSIGFGEGPSRRGTKGGGLPDTPRDVERRLIERCSDCDCLRGTRLVFPYANNRH